MADDRSTSPPASRPRRRRTDIDPNAPSPPVANERRRGHGRADSAPDAVTDDPARSEQWASVAARLVEHATPADTADLASTAAVAGASSAEVADETTAPFHVPGHAAAVVAPPPVVVQPVTAEPARLAPDPGRAWLTRLEDRSLNPTTCPFLRASADGTLITPIERPDPANRCAALAEAVPQSLRQQELVCLTSGHVSCPRYLRGAAVATEKPAPVVSTGRTLTTPMFASLVLLVMAVSASAAFAIARGGIGLTAAAPSPSATAIAVAAPPSPLAPAASPSSAVASAPPSVSVIPSPSMSPSSSPSPAATPSRAATPTRKPTPAPKSDRYKLLKACPGTPRCWIYTVRSGDNLYSIANYFGVSQSSIRTRNPWLKNTGLRAGQQLRLPPPTR